MHPRQLVQAFLEMRSLPEVEVRMYGDERVRRTFASFTRPHPTYRLIQNKRWGVGLLELPGSFEEYLGGRDRAYLRRKRNRALARGLHFEAFAPMERLQEILLINSSAPVRQKRAMDADYLDIAELARFFQNKPRIYGVLDGQGALRAYADAPVLGEVALLSRLLGHAEDLEDGIMYLLVSEVIREMIELKARQGAPAWAMYDTFFGAQPGLRFFKEQLGFSPYKVKWTWVPKTDRSGDGS